MEVLALLQLLLGDPGSPCVTTLVASLPLEALLAAQQDLTCCFVALETIWRPLGGRLEATWRPLGGPLQATWRPSGRTRGQVVLQEAPSWSQEAESWAQETPCWPQEAPSWLEEAPSWLQEAPERLQVGPNRCPRGPEELSESSPAVFEQLRGQNLEFARPYHTLEGFGRTCRSVWRAKWSLSCAWRSVWRAKWSPSCAQRPVWSAKWSPGGSKLVPRG